MSLTSQTQRNPGWAEILHLTAKGLSNDEVAKHTGYAVQSVKSALAQMRQAAGASNTTHLIYIAVMQGLVDK